MLMPASGIPVQALMRVNWRKAYDSLSSVTSWSLLPNQTEVLVSQHSADDPVHSLCRR